MYFSRNFPKNLDVTRGISGELISARHTFQIYISKTCVIFAFCFHIYLLFCAGLLQKSEPMSEFGGFRVNVGDFKHSIQGGYKYFTWLQ